MAVLLQSVRLIEIVSHGAVHEPVSSNEDWLSSLITGRVFGVIVGASTSLSAVSVAWVAEFPDASVESTVIFIVPSSSPLKSSEPV